MNLVDTRRLRVTVRRFNPGYGERFQLWSFGTYRSSDHGKPRQETNVSGAVVGMQWHVKWRPDGKSTALRTGAPHD